MKRVVCWIWLCDKKTWHEMLRFTEITTVCREGPEKKYGHSHEVTTGTKRQPPAPPAEILLSISRLGPGGVSGP